MNAYATDPNLRHNLLRLHASRPVLFALAVLQAVYPIALVVSPCLAVFTFVSSVMGSLESEPMWLGLMHVAVIAEMPLIIACIVENRFVQQQKPTASLERISRARQALVYLVTCLWCLTTLVSLLARPSCAEGAPWRLSLTPKVLPLNAENMEDAALANCEESLVALALSVANTVLCLVPVVCTLVVEYAVASTQPTSVASYEILPNQVPC